jgi:hypothetical protein
MEGLVVSARIVRGVALAALGALCACGSSPQSLTDGAGETRGASATPSGPEATANASVCVEGALRTCTVELPTQGSVHQCFSGKQLCTGGAWSDCQDPSVLVGVRTEPFAAACPAGASPRWTTLDYTVDVPGNASGGADVAITVAGHPELVLFTAQSAGRGSTEHSAGSLDVGPELNALADQADLSLQIATTTTPDGAMAATAQATLKYSCSK